MNSSETGFMRREIMYGGGNFVAAALTIMCGLLTWRSGILDLPSLPTFKPPRLRRVSAAMRDQWSQQVQQDLGVMMRLLVRFVSLLLAMSLLTGCIIEPPGHERGGWGWHHGWHHDRD